MTVYVAVSGVYSERAVAGVYDSLESAIAAHDTEKAQWRYHEWGVWRAWDNQLDMDSAISIEPFELTAETPGAELLDRIRAMLQGTVA